MVSAQRADANELQATVIWSVQPMWANGTWTDYTPTNRWATNWRTWYNTSGAEGEEPPAAVQRIYELQEGRVRAMVRQHEMGRRGVGAAVQGAERITSKAR